MQSRRGSTFRIQNRRREDIRLQEGPCGQEAPGKKLQTDELLAQGMKKLGQPALCQQGAPANAIPALYSTPADTMAAGH